MDKLGIEIKLILAQIVNFAIIMIVLNKLLYKPILSMLEKRKKKIQEGLALTEQMKVEEEKMEVKKSKMLTETKKEGMILIEEAKVNAKNEAKQILESAHTEADEIVEKGKQQTTEQKVMMEKEVRQEAIVLATGMAKRLLSSIMTQETQHAVLKKHIKELQEIA
ncbi:MAG: ATP synthase F0 subunit B [Candidatus Gottesmanbacteria bacterium]